MIGFQSFIIEITVNGITYTNNNQTIKFFKTPKISSIYINDKQQSSETIKLLVVKSQYIYAKLKPFKGISQFLNNAFCKLNGKNWTVSFRGEFINYPYNAKAPKNPYTILCLTPDLLKIHNITLGNAFLSFSVNGVNYFGKTSVKLIPYIRAFSIT